MKSKFLILPLLAGVKMALATGHGHENPPHLQPTINTEASADATSASRSSAEADASSSSTSEAASDATSNSGGNVLNSSTVFRGVRQAPGALAIGTNTTQPCSGEWHLGGSSPVGGLSFGKSRTNKDCMFAELAADELARGSLQASIQLRCRISYYKEALGDDCEALLNTQTSNAVSSAREVRYADPAKRAADRAKLLQEVSK